LCALLADRITWYVYCDFSRLPSWCWTTETLRSKISSNCPLRAHRCSSAPYTDENRSDPHIKHLSGWYVAWERSETATEGRRGEARPGTGPNETHERTGGASQSTMKWHIKRTTQSQPAAAQRARARHEPTSASGGQHICRKRGRGCSRDRNIYRRSASNDRVHRRWATALSNEWRR